MAENEDSDVELYGDASIASKDAPVPLWLKWNYCLWIVFGLVWFYLFWNGSYGWFDRGYWQELQRAASTTFPYHVNEIAVEAAREDLPAEHL